MYDRQVAGQTLSFGVSGKLYRNSLIMYDRETETLWSHLLGAGVDGELAGTRLETIPAFFGEWGAWKALHPGSLALSPARSPYGDYGDSYAGYYTSQRTGIQGIAFRDDRLEPKDLVLGVMAPAAKAYSFADVEQEGVIRDRLAGSGVEIVWNAAASNPAAFLVDSAGKTLLPSTPIFWFAWVDFFPGAPLWASGPSELPARSTEPGSRSGASSEDPGRSSSE